MEWGINKLVFRLDRFFGDATHQAFEPPVSRVRVRNEVWLGARNAWDTRTRVAADVRLPAANRWLSRISLGLTGETEPTPVPDTDGDPIPPRFDTRLRAAGASGAGLELRYDLFRASRTLVDVGAGARFATWPPAPYSRIRLDQRFPMGVRIVGHLAQSLYWDQTDGFGEATRIDVERAFGPWTLARLWMAGTVDERSRGYEWASEAGVQRALGARTAIYPALAIAGATQSVAGVDNYRVFTRLRQDVRGGWLFVELEPDVSWPADVLGHRSHVYGVIVRFELLFWSDRKSPPPLCTTVPSDGASGRRVDVVGSARTRPGA